MSTLMNEGDMEIGTPYDVYALMARDTTPQWELQMIGDLQKEGRGAIARTLPEMTDMLRERLRQM